ncbi:DUF6920 family protein [Winogradskyella sp.]|uniref:DUF6920 family protein n=1 Tax=Winogradskyella sp. TaxID=1883156 RepID=UPI003F6D72B8
MKYVFSFVVLIHGIIHLKGFIDAFFTSGVNQQVLGISKPVGAVWLITFVLFIFSVIQYLTDKNWFYIAFIAVILSQILIIMNWDEAKYGSIINIVIFVIGLVAYGAYNFDTSVKAETSELLYGVPESSNLISRNENYDIPEIVKKWIENSYINDTKEIASVSLKQKGEMRTKPNGKWMPFEANQYFNVLDPSFIWITKVRAAPFINLCGRDKLIEGKGEMLIKLVSLIPVVNEKENFKINQGAMLRYLAEICWFPSAALNNYITWSSINNRSAKATFTYDNQSVSGVFSFNNDGDFISFEAQRYYGGNENSKLKTWCIEALDYKTFNGIRIPHKNKVTWKLENEYFHWLSLEIKEINYN